MTDSESVPRPVALVTGVSRLRGTAAAVARKHAQLPEGNVLICCRGLAVDQNEPAVNCRRAWWGLPAASAPDGWRNILIERRVDN